MGSNNRRLVVLLLGLALVVAAIVLLRRQPGLPPARAPDALELLPRTCQVAVVVPELGRLGEHLAVLPRLKLAELAASLGDYPSSEAFLSEIVRQAGYDPRSRESLRSAGIDPSRALVGYLSQEGAPLVAVPEADAARLEDVLARNAAARAGASERHEEKVGDKTLVTVAPSPGAPPIAWLHAGGYFFLAQGVAGVGLLKSVATQKPADSLATDPRLLSVRQKLGARDVFAFRCVDSPQRKNPWPVPYGSAIGASLSERELDLSVELPLTDAQAQEYRSLGRPAGADLVTRLDPNAFLVGRLGGDPALLKDLVDALLPTPFQHAFQEGGIDPKEQILGNLKPGVAFCLTLAPTAKLSGVPELDPRRTNPFEYVLLNALGRAADPEKAAATISKFAGVAPRFGARFEQRAVDGTKVFVARYQLGEGASLALKGDFALVTGGQGQMEALLKRLDGPGALVIGDAEAQRVLKEDGAALYLDVRKLTAGVRALPDSAYGVGGFAIKAAISRWLDAIDEISGLRLSARLADQTVHAELALSLKLPQAQKDAGAP